MRDDRLWMRPIAAGLALLLAAMALPAPAGPWERAAGTGFVAGTLGVEETSAGTRGFAEAYGEGGWPGALVPSVKLRVAGAPGSGGRGEAEADLRLRWHPGWSGAVALGLELGVRGETATLDAAGGAAGSAGFGVAALHLGRGFAAPGGAGWGRVSLAAQEPLGSRGRSRLEGMAQLGLRSESGWLGLVSLSVFERAGDSTVKLMPAVGRSLAPGRDLLLEVTVERGGARTRGLALGLWQAF